MKNFLCFIPFLFLFFQKIDAQVEPRLVKKVTLIYDDAQRAYMDELHELWEYDNRGNLIAESQISFDINGEINSWKGKANEYDEDNKLIKQIQRRYNWLVEIWIKMRWVEFIYDTDDCLIERRVTPNSILDPTSTQVLITDDECKELGYVLYNEEEEYEGEGEIEYDDKGNITYTKNYFYVDAFDSLFLSNGTEQIYNDKNDKLVDFNYTLWGSGAFFDYEHELLEYEYEYDLTNGLLHKKYQTTFQIIYPNNYRFQQASPPDATLFEIAEIDFHYSCDDLLQQEDIAFEQFEPDGNSFLGKRRILYFYEGKDPCFEHENNFEIEIYPNPTSEILNIKSPFFGSGNTRIQVFDFNGKILLEQSNPLREEGTTINVDHLAEGIYTIRLLSDAHFVSEKFIVVK